MAKFWSGVAVAFESALATAVSITGITQASTAVVSHAGVNPSNGDFVLLRVEGMNEVNGLVARVANADASPGDHFELEGIDSSAFAAFTSGTFEVITFGNSLSTVVDVSASGGEPEYEDITTIHDTQRKEAPTVVSPIAYDFTSIFEPGNAGLVALKTASRAKDTRAFKFTFSDGSLVVFDAYVSSSDIPTGSAQGLVTQAISLRGDGDSNSYAS